MWKAEYIKGALPSGFGGLTLQTKERRLLSAGGTRPATTGVERRNANVCYIFGLDPDRYLHCRSRRIVLHNLREKENSRHYPNSDGCYNVTN